jgi:hypothetical protein
MMLFECLREILIEKMLFRDGKGDRLAMYALGLFYSTTQRVDASDPMSVITPVCSFLAVAC